jgi:hypothetical protein
MSEQHSTIEDFSLAAHADSEEAWRDIPEFPDYQASNLGRVRSRKWGTWKVLRPTAHSRTGYLVVSLRVGGRYIARSVHRLIAATFLGEAAGRDVNHKNGDKQDNTVANLEYLSRGDNHRHAYRTGLRPPVGKKLHEDQIREIAALKGILTQKAIAKRFGVSRTTIGRIHSGERHQLLLT